MARYDVRVHPLRYIQHLIQEGEYVDSGSLETALRGQSKIPQDVLEYHDRLAMGEAKRRPGPKSPRLATRIRRLQIRGIYRYYLNRLTSRKKQRGAIVGLAGESKTFLHVTPGEIAARITAKFLGLDHNRSWHSIQNIVSHSSLRD